jgi:hypothetical protein
MLCSKNIIMRRLVVILVLLCLYFSGILLGGRETSDRLLC